ncbi:Uncharacterised protein [Arachnia propionica]|nr:Uncharacterised protein [Arachnia propionica]
MERCRGVDVFAVDGFVALVERLIGLPWPIKVDQFEPTAQQLGWSPANVSGFFTGNFASEEQRIMLNEDEEKNITVVSLPFFRPEGEGVEETGLINDAFVAYAAAGVEAWGKPFRIVIDRYSHMVWKYPQNVIVELTRYERFVDLSFYTPQGILAY